MVRGRVLPKARFPAAVLYSLVVGGISVGLFAACWNLHWPTRPGFELLTHCMAGLALGWAIVAMITRRRHPVASPESPPHDFEAVVDVATLVASLFVVIIMTYTATTEALVRSPFLIDYERGWHVHIWPTGLLNVGMVLTATLLAWKRTGSGSLATASFWLFILAGFWLSLQFPATRYVTTVSGAVYPAAGPWPLVLLVWSAGTVAVWSAVESLTFRRRRARAWPYHLERLLETPRGWPGLDESAAIMGLAVLLLSIIHIVSAWSALSVLVAGIAILALAGRRWNANLGDLGLGLFSVGIVSLPLQWPLGEDLTSNQRFAEIFNRALLGLAFATFFWHWLARFWDQQLDHGRAWTTAGRLLACAQRTGYLCGATGLLVGAHLAIWPLMPQVTEPDNHLWRWVLGLFALLMLTGALVHSARVARKTTLAWLSVWAVAVAVTFVLARLAPTPVGGFWRLCWPVVVAMVGLVGLPLSWLANRHRGWRPFVPPLFLTSILLAPLAAIIGVTLSDQFRTLPWVPPAVFAVLAAVYLLASLNPGPRRFLILSVVTGGACFYYLSALAR